jgi:hypothetical protein
MQGSWWLSICVETAPRRAAGTEAGEIRFDLVDTFAETKGDIPQAPVWRDILAAQEDMDKLKAERDTRYPRKPGRRPNLRWRRMTGRIGKLSARIARIRRERLHEWTTAVTRQASDLVITAPPVKSGDEKRQGRREELGRGR